VRTTARLLTRKDRKERIGSCPRIVTGKQTTGLEMFRKELPCVVVLDLELPGISGKELCREFKAQAPSVFRRSWG